LVFLNWNPAVAANSYILYRSTNNAGPYPVVATGVIVTNYTDANALSGRTNYYIVASVGNCGTGATSAAVSVPLARPVLGFAWSAAGGRFTINWPAWANNWGLWSATNLAPPVTWYPVTNSAGSNNGHLSVTLPLQPSREFFRLTSP
jgi:hypothetical protein